MNVDYGTERSIMQTMKQLSLNYISVKSRLTHLLNRLRHFLHVGSEYSVLLNASVQPRLSQAEGR